MDSPNFIIIDGSYFVFFRYYALLNWFKLAKKDEEMDDPFKNKTFVEKFRSTFISKMKEIPKKLKSGVYFARLKFEDKIEIQKLVKH